MCVDSLWNCLCRNVFILTYKDFILHYPQVRKCPCWRSWIFSVQNNLLMLALLAFEVTIYRHQKYFRLRNKLSPPAACIIFHDITRQHLDIGIVCFVKYFINYFFYKFGLEVRCFEGKRRRFEMKTSRRLPLQQCPCLLCPVDMPAFGRQRHWPADGLLRHASRLCFDSGHV